MNRTGMQMQMLSNIAKALDALQAANDYAACLVRRHSARFGLLAALPTDDPDAALEEASRGAATAPTTIAAALAMTSADRLVYGSDCGVPCTTDATMDANIAALRSVAGLSADVVERIGRNALSLFPAAAARIEANAAAGGDGSDGRQDRQQPARPAGSPRIKPPCPDSSSSPTASPRWIDTAALRRRSPRVSPARWPDRPSGAEPATIKIVAMSDNGCFGAAVNLSGQPLQGSRMRRLRFTLLAALAALGLSSGGQARAGEANFAHIFISGENRGYKQIIGNPAAPTINRLAKAYGGTTRYDAVVHPSQANDLAILLGSPAGMHDDDACFCATGRTEPLCSHANRGNDDYGPHAVSGRSLVDQLADHGLTWQANVTWVADDGFQPLRGPGRCRAAAASIPKPRPITAAGRFP